MIRKSKKKLKVLITAGPTHEYIDAVKYITNNSTGLMGFSLAEIAKELGCEVTLIAGPLQLDTPKGVKRIDVVNAYQLFDKVKTLATKSDLIIMSAAVTDFRPQKFLKTKIKRETLKGEKIIKNFKLVSNPDILAYIGKRKKNNQVIVGFALETENLEKNAISKLKKKKCDWIVANKLESIGSLSSSALLISKQGKKIKLPKLPKHDLAMLILSYILDF